MSERSNRSEVRNPVLALPSSRLLQTMPGEPRIILAVLLLDLSRDARNRARVSWGRRKAFVAAYWATVAVYAGHIARALAPPGHRRSLRKPFRIVQRGYPDFSASTWAEASDLYCARRDREGLGASRFPEASVLIADLPVGRISYNGRIWARGEWQPGDLPLYDNRTGAP